ncbi:MAG: hypothetical protein OJF61_000448 [Rhodanobacteraceae bacterium]|nr:MAG: hypothetical protein OJF61_000448 [Rhodanobacteraceae bacterium]
MTSSRAGHGWPLTRDPVSLILVYRYPCLFRAPPGGAGDFLLRGQEKVTKEKATPRTRPEHIRVLRIRERSPGFAEGTSLCLRRTGPHPAGHPSDFSVVRSPCSRGPVWRASCALSPQRRLPYLAANEAMDGSRRSDKRAFGGAEKRSRSREQGAHVRGHGWPSSRRRAIGEHRRAVERTRCSFDHRHRRMVFGYFLP